MQFSFTTKRQRFQLTWERIPKHKPEHAKEEKPEDDQRAVVGTYRHPGYPTHTLGFTTPATDRRKRIHNHHEGTHHG